MFGCAQAGFYYEPLLVEKQVAFSRVPWAPDSRQQALDMYRMLPAAELAILPNTTHMATLTPLCMQIVLDFLLRQRD